MEEGYSVYYNNMPVGKAIVTKVGLYLQIKCHCIIQSKSRFRLIMNSNDTKVDLGLFASAGGAGEISRQIPMKKAGNPPYIFKLEEECPFVVVSEHSPFAMLSQLEKARFTVRNEEAGVLIDKS